MMTKIQQALPEDHLLITQLTKRSKGHWKYGAAQIDLWSDDLTITAQYIADNMVYKLIQNDHIIAYYALLQLPESILKIDNLFVDTNAIGKGWGKFLMEDIFAKAKKMTAQKITLDADPNAESFYLHFGFETVGKIPTSIPGRFLSIMEKVILPKF